MRRGTWIAAGALLLLAAGLLVLLKPWQGSPPVTPLEEPEIPDPRVTYNTPFKDVRPGVKYVDDSLCADCHGAIAKSFKQHPMSQSLGPVDKFFAIEAYSDKASFEAGGYEYSVARKDGKTTHREKKVGA